MNSEHSDTYSNFDLFYAQIYNADLKIDGINFWYFFYFFVFSYYEKFYVNELTAYNLKRKMNNFDETTKYLSENSFIELLESLVKNYQGYKNIRSNKYILDFVLKKKYIPLVCLRFICQKKNVDVFPINNLKPWLKDEFNRFKDMANDYFNNAELLKKNETNKIPQDLLILMAEIEEKF